MSNTEETGSMIDEIDSRQSEILDQLDDLNYRVEQLLQQHGSSRKLDAEIVDTYSFTDASGEDGAT